MVRLGPIAACAMLMSVSFGGAMAQTRIAVDTPTGPQFGPESTGLARIAPELRPALEAGAAFVGVTEAGEAVIELRPGDGAGRAPAAFESARGSRPLPEGEDVATVDELTVFLKPGDALASTSSVGSFDVVERYREGGFVVVRSADGFDAEELRALMSDPRVDYIEPNFPQQLQQSAAPNDAHFVNALLWGMENIGAPDAWNVANESDVIIAVLDTGVDFTHRDLRQNVWVNEGEYKGPDVDPFDGQDDDGNGYVDDLLGYDFIEENGAPMDRHGHGTHVAGTVAAHGHNAEGVVGVLWRARVMAVRIFGPEGESAGAVKVAKAIDYAVQNGAKVLNNSWGGGNYARAIKEAIDRSEAGGALFVAAAGNDGADNDANEHFPASYPNANIVSVMSIDRNGERSGFSNVGATSVDIAAPGASVVSAGLSGDYTVRSGTSMAAPHVAGALALVWAQPAFHERNAVEIKDVVLRSARRSEGLGGLNATGATLDLGFLVGAMATSAVATVSSVSDVSSVPSAAGAAFPRIDRDALEGFATRVFAARAPEPSPDAPTMSVRPASAPSAPSTSRPSMANEQTPSSFDDLNAIIMGQ